MHSYEDQNCQALKINKTCTQQNSFSIRHLLGTVTSLWLDSGGIVTDDNCLQHGDYTVDQLCSHRAAGS